MNEVLERVRVAVSSLIDIILPRHTRRIRSESLSEEDIPLMPETHALLGKEIITLMHYEDARDIIQSLKYDRSTRTARLIATTIAEYLREEIASHRQFSQKPIVLVPVPLHSSRHAERGYNQIEIVLDALPHEFKNGSYARVAPIFLERIRMTPPQTRLTRAERLSNVAGAFKVPDASTIRGMHIYLIDDVTTTGATLVHAGRSLKDAGADVTLIALARA